MAEIRPFRAIRPRQGLEERIAALPYDVYNTNEARREVEREPLSFLRIDRAETQFSEETDPYSDQVYEKAHDLLWEMVKSGELIQEKEDCYYIYELIMDGRSQTGITACASVDDYRNEVIKKHENTRADKEIDRISHVDRCSAQTGPIFLAYRSHPVIREVTERTKFSAPLYDFRAPDGISHRIWKIEDQKDATAVTEAFRQVDSIYIADGHHRCASAVKVSLKRRAQYPDYTGKEEFNFFLSVLFPDEELMILDYNRVVKDLNGHTPEALIHKISSAFEVTKIGCEPYKPEKKGCFGMYLERDWYRLTVKDTEGNLNDPVSSLDVALLQEHLLKPILGIEDPKTDKRIDFVGGIRGLKELERRVREDCAVAFSMFPTGINELFAVSDAGLLMPPKSTWFEPKLRSGLLIHAIES